MNYPLPFHTAEQVSLEAVEREPDQIILHVATTSSSSACPLCGTHSRHIHSRYARTLRDLPVFGLPVRVRLIAHRFFCRYGTILVDPEHAVSSTYFRTGRPMRSLSGSRRTRAWK